MGLSFAKWVRAYARQTLYAAVAMLGCAQAIAQELQEVVVTAERREEKLQDVPIAVTAFTNAALVSRNISNINQLANLTPSVNLDAGSPFSGDRSVLSASIRGIGQDDFAFNLNPGVGVYLDGVFLARTIGANVNLLDVDRVEILKGPQGTLFGANTIGGAISVVTHTPGDTPRFIGTITGGKFNRRDAAFTADIPIADNLLTSITVASQNQTGWARTIPYPTNSPYGQTPFVVDPDTAFPKSGYQTSDSWGGTGVFSVRGKMLWHASDKMDWTFTADWSHEDQTALPYTILNVYQGNLAFSTFSTLWNLCISNDAATLPGAIQANGGPPTFVPTNGLFAGICSQPRAHVPGLSVGGAPLVGAGYVGGPAGPYNINNHPGTAYLGTNQPRIWFSLPATQTGNIDTTYSTGPNFARNDVFGGSATGVFHLSDTLDLKSITGYRQIKWNIGTDLDGTPETLQEVTDAQHQWQVSQELQLLGKALDNNLNYVGGLYYFKEAGYVHDYVPFESILYVYDQSNDIQNEDYAAFLNLDYRLGNWGFSAGGRYTHVKTNFLGGQSDLNSFPIGSGLWPIVGPTVPVSAGGGGAFLRYFPAIPDSQSWDIFDPKVGIQYHFSPDVMAYASWAKGFKQGGWTTRLSAVIADPTIARFNPEYSETYELGLKSEWFSHRLLTNAAVYYTNYNGIQLNIQQGISPVYTNAGNAKIKGAELELQWLVGGGLQINLTGAYIDAYYTYVNPNANIPQSLLPDGTNVCPSTAIVPGAGGPHPVCAKNPPGVTQLDAKLPKTPKYKGTIWPSYNYLLPSQATLRLIAAFTYTSEIWNDSLNTPELRRPASRNLDASIHYLSPGGKYDLSFGGTNLTNDRYCTAGSPNAGAGEVGCYYNPPLMWYVSLRAEFGGK